jgi:hypothetical protein
MPDEKLDHYNPNYTYKKETITIDKSIKSDFPVLEAVDNAALFPEAIKNNIDLEQLKPYH